MTNTTSDDTLSPIQTQAGKDVPPPPARDKALQNTDILREIFIHLRLPPFFKHGSPINESESSTARSGIRKDLGRTALVCRTFCGPARDALWSSLDSLRPIFRVYGRDGTTFGNLSAFREIAKKVREINHHPHTENAPVASRMILHLAGRIASAPDDQSKFLFPALRVLRCTPNTDRIPEISRLLSPSLEHFALYDITNATLAVVNTLIIELIYLVPSLHNLELRGDVADMLLDDILRFRSLTSLSITCSPGGDGVPVGKLTTLGQLQCLQRIEIYLADWRVPSGYPYCERMWRSASTHTLKVAIVQGNPAALVEFMAGIEGASLSHLDVTIKSAPGLPEHYYNRVSMSFQKAGNDSIRNLTILDAAGILTRGRQPRDSSSSSNEDFVRFFHGFSKLESLNYRAPRFNLTNSELSKLMSSRRRSPNNSLWEFSMSDIDRPGDGVLGWYEFEDYLPPVSELAALTQTYLRLKHIKLNLNIASSNIPSLDNLTSLQSSLSLEILSVGCPLTQEKFDVLVYEGAVLRLGAYLCQLFPNLREIRYRETSPLQTKFWKLVFRVVEYTRRFIVLKQ